MDDKLLALAWAMGRDEGLAKTAGFLGSVGGFMSRRLVTPLMGSVKTRASERAAGTVMRNTWGRFKGLAGQKAFVPGVVAGAAGAAGVYGAYRGARALLGGRSQGNTTNVYR